MTYEVFKTKLPEVLILTPKIFKDTRGYFFESFNQKKFNKATDLKVKFVQDNRSKSKKNVLRGLHYQIFKPQGKLISVTYGKIFDVVVDIRENSRTFGKWIGVIISDKNKKQLWVPKGFAHGFVAISETAELLYKTTEYWHPNYEKCIIWNDKDLKIKWPIKNPIISPKDKLGKNFKNAKVFK